MHFYKQKANLNILHWIFHHHLTGKASQWTELQLQQRGYLKVSCWQCLGTDFCQTGGMPPCLPSSGLPPPGSGSASHTSQIHNTQIHKDTNTLIQKVTNTQINKDTYTQIHKDTNTQIQKVTNTQIHKYTNT